jgi:uncharacterized protein (TIGR03435 family)
VAMTVKGLVRTAYNAKYDTISGGPVWVDSEHFDINAKVEDSFVEGWNKLSERERDERIRPMILSLLEDRFLLKVTRETKEVPVYVLVVAKKGLKLTPAAPLPADADNSGSRIPQGMMLSQTGDGWVAKNITMGEWAAQLSGQLDLSRLVEDETGLKGEYDFKLRWSPHRDGSGPALTTALEEQLGLKLETRKKMVETIVIEHVERPSEN